MNTEIKPEYWIEIHYLDKTSRFTPFLGDADSAKSQCAQIIAMDVYQFIEAVVLLRGDYIPETIALSDQILAIFQGSPAKGFKQWKT